MWTRQTSVLRRANTGPDKPMGDLEPADSDTKGTREMEVEAGKLPLPKIEVVTITDYQI